MEIKIFISEIYKGKTLGRILFNLEVQRACKDVSRKTLDLAGGNIPSYLRFLPEGINLISSDIKNSSKFIDINKPLPFSDEEFYNIFFFNALYIAEDPQRLLLEVNRVLARDGKLFISSPFLVAEMPEPHDYARYTAEKIESMLRIANFKSLKIRRVGGRFSASVNLLHDFLFFKIIRLIAYSLAVWLDGVTDRFQSNHPAPILYFVEATK